MLVIRMMTYILERYIPEYSIIVLFNGENRVREYELKKN